MPAALVIEDQPEIAGFVVEVFCRLGCQARGIASVIEAIELLENSPNIDVVFLNLSNIIEETTLLKLVANRWPAIKLILLSDHLIDLRELPPCVFVAKPSTPAVMGAIIEKVARTIARPKLPSRGETFH